MLPGQVTTAITFGYLNYNFELYMLSINNKYIIIVLKHHIHDSSSGELIKPQKAPKTPTNNL